MIGNGNVDMIVTSSDGDPISPIWSAETQPQAFNASIDEHGLLMGVGQGAVARYRWFDSAQRLAGIWDPFDGNRPAAIGYASTANATLVVTSDGDMVAVSDDGEESLVWDGATADRRAFAVTSGAGETLLSTEDGSVARMALDGRAEPLGLVWDTTGEALSPAAQVVLLGS